jgi:pyruvate, orthophosphate dikinase
MQIVHIDAGSNEQPSAEIVGAKAANLARMAVLGLPVPPAFVLPVNLCAAVARDESDARRSIAAGLSAGVAFLEKATGKTFGDRRRPLLVSVRSGAARSMPGMLDTVLNVGCTPAAVRGLIRISGYPRFAHDCRRRFLESFGTVVLGVDASLFKERLDELVRAEDVGGEQMLDGEALERLADSYQQALDDSGYAVPDDPVEQLRAATEAVYRSWFGDRARTYRELQHFQDLRGTAVTVQAMVFGNSGDTSGAGVAFSRDPSTGAVKSVIDVLFCAQGEDVVSGRCNPQTEEAVERVVPQAAAQLRGALARLEQEFGDVQDVEFTIEDGKLWMLQTRAAKRTPQAALRFAIDFVNEGRIAPAEALRRLDGVDLAALATCRLAEAGKAIASGTGASSGIAVGRIALDREAAGRLAASGEPVILMRPDTNTADVAGFAVAAGIVTALGGRTAHAALVARQLGKPCIVGCAGLAIDTNAHCARFGEHALKEGDWLTIDGSAGEIYPGRGKIVCERPEAELTQIEKWRTQMLQPA